MLSTGSFQSRHAVGLGLRPEHRLAAARLYWQGFGREILPFAIPEDRGTALVAAALRPEMALVARAPDGGLAAMAGIRDARGGFLGLDDALLLTHCGPLRGRLACMAGRWHRSGPETGDMVLDGLIVRPELRGRGYGQALVAAAAELARARGYHGLRVELAASNTAARALYRLLGFVPCGSARIGWPWSGPAEIMRFANPAADSCRSSPSPAPAR